MTDVTYFVALPFVAADDGVAAGEPTECFNPVAVVMRAEALSRKPGHVGAVAFNRTGDAATGEFSSYPRYAVHRIVTTESNGFASPPSVDQ